MKKILLAFLCLMAIPANAATIGQPIVSVQTSTASSSLVVKSSSGLLNGFSATAGGTSGYILIFDLASVPSNGTVTPRFCYALPANQTTGASWLTYPVNFNNGIVIEFSSTGCFTATSSATAFLSAQYQ